MQHLDCDIMLSSVAMLRIYRKNDTISASHDLRQCIDLKFSIVSLLSEWMGFYEYVENIQETM